ncbi:DUF4192 family protein [Arthrobacter sp. AETb3-4]|uniref:DUF4192 family protein n=1 Tax=Arthrobacter wenxiniae TaxID=2713570 RepID=A0A7Y7LZN1_9MICC|nr:DUF4192 family protein [Arthrobacter wenxiniae]
MTANGRNATDPSPGKCCRRSYPILPWKAGVIQWWEGRNSHAHECFQRALEADPDYRLAQLTDQMLGAHIIAPWAMDRNAAYQPPMNRGPGIEGLDMA